MMRDICLILPEQEIKDGVVTMRVLIGHYDRAAFENASELYTSRAIDFVPAARPGKQILRKPLDRELLILNDIPGVRAHAYLSPGRTTGTADILFKLDTTEKEGGAIYVDNYGSRYTGRWRLGGSYHRNNLSHVGDQLTIGALRSNTDEIRNYDIRYELPVGSGGIFAGAEYFKTDYELGKQYRKYDATGLTHGWRVYMRQPLKRTLNNNTYFHLEYGESNLVDRFGAYDIDSEKKNRVTRFGFEGLWRGQKQASRAKLMHHLGDVHRYSDDT